MRHSPTQATPLPGRRAATRARPSPVMVNPSRPVRTALLLLLLSLFTPPARSQEQDSAGHAPLIKGAVTLTNNGISTIPTFTLGKPAVMFDMSMGKKLSFEPQLRFALEGKPWTFVFWWRYKLLQTRKVHVSMGAHPAIAFQTVPLATSSGTAETLVARRFLAGELSLNYASTPHLGSGLYYLYSHGIDQSTTRNTHFLGLNTSLRTPTLPHHLTVSANPQLYYLKLDDRDGFYLTSRFAVVRQNLPLSLSVLINKALQTDIVVGEGFAWNVSLTYDFRK